MVNTVIRFKWLRKKAIVWYMDVSVNIYGIEARTIIFVSVLVMCAHVCVCTYVCISVFFIIQSSL